MTSLNKAFLAGVLGLPLLAAGTSAKVLEDTVAVVNAAPIMLSEYNKELNSALDYWGRINPGALANPSAMKELREKTLEQLIDHEVLYQEGVKLKIKVRERDIDSGIDEIKRNFKKDETGKVLTEAESEAAFLKQLKHEGLSFQQFRERLSKQIMARKVLDQEVKQKLKLPEEKEVKDYFDKVTAYLQSGSTAAPKGMEGEPAMAFREIAQQIKALSSERVRAARILIKFSPGASLAEKKRALSTAKAVKKRLDAGEDFAAVARTDSEDPESAAQGGDIGIIVKGMTPVEFEKLVFAMQVGDISEPVETDFGYHIVRVSEKRVAEKPEFDKFKDQLTQFMANVTVSLDVEKFVKALKAKAVVERNLPAVQSTGQ